MKPSAQTIATATLICVAYGLIAASMVGIGLFIGVFALSAVTV